MRHDDAGLLVPTGYSQEWKDGTAEREAREPRQQAQSQIRTFETGANRNTDQGKLDYEGFLSPIVLERFAQYLHKHRHLENGEYRDSDNWQKGIPRDVYMKSLLRHVLDMWKQHRGFTSQEEMEDSICAVMFNAMGYLFERLQGGGNR